MKKNLSLLVLFFISSTFLFASTNTSKRAEDFTEKPAVFEDGWFWYEVEVKDDNKTKKTIKYKVSPSQKQSMDTQKETNKLLRELIVKMDEQNQRLKKIEDRLNYAFPDTTPKYGINSKGEKCLANSSADCFVMPVIAEGQHLPVLKNFLRNPSPENAKKWLQWQATYFNHISNISYGLRFKYLEEGSEAYPTDTTYTLGDNLFFSKSESAKAGREALILKKYKDRFVYLFFIGKDRVFEKVINLYSQVANYPTTYLKDVKYAFIFPSKKSYDLFKKDLEQLKKQGYEGIYKVFSTAPYKVSPDLYAKYKIRTTPSAVVYYKDKKNKKSLHQVITSGTLDVNNIRRGTIEFLKYYGIINPKEMGADKNWATLNKDRFENNLTKIPSLNKPKEFNTTTGENNETK
jgi:hypothetical protein